MDLSLIWALIIAFVIMMYVMLDGFDLGVGILFLWVRPLAERDLMMSTVLPVWDGNETWLVLGAACLYGAFPLAYSTLLPILYLPIFIMLAALVFRGVSLEFRFKANRSRWIWDVLFCLGSLVAAFCQGLLLGNFVKGIPPEAAASVVFDQWFSPYAVFCGFAAIFAYALMGSAWLIRKTEGQLRDKMYFRIKWLIAFTGLFLLLMSVWTLFVDPYITKLWLTTARMPFMFIIPFLACLTFALLMFGVFYRHDRLPFYGTIGLFFWIYLGFIINVWPYAVPRLITFREAASPAVSQQFMLVGVAILLPVLLAYTYYSYHVFRGKVRDVHHY